MPQQKMMNSGMQECIDTCFDCSRTCLETLSHCLNLEGPHKEAKHISLLQICADICQVSARAMTFGLEQHSSICRACADLCRDCATDCRQFQDDKIMANCADVCEKCASSCEQMASMDHKSQSKSQQQTQAQI
jgi:hypothetical protein